MQQSVLLGLEQLHDNNDMVTLSADPVARINSFFGLKETQLISAACASTEKFGLEAAVVRVSQLTITKITINDEILK